MISWLFRAIDTVTESLFPLDDELLISNYRKLGRAFLFTASDRELRRLADLVSIGRAPALTDVAGGVLWTKQHTEALIKQVTAGVTSAGGETLGAGIARLVARSVDQGRDTLIPK
jgi:hypothetical protein